MKIIYLTIKATVTNTDSRAILDEIKRNKRSGVTIDRSPFEDIYLDAEILNVRSADKPGKQK